MKRNSIYILAVLLVLVLAGCETLNKVDKAIANNQVRIQKFFSGLFLTESESINFAVRIRHEFFVYLPPMDEKEMGVEELSNQIIVHLAQSQVDTLINKNLEKEARKQGTKELAYLETDKYRVFIEPRFLSFEYCDGTPPVFATLNEGLYALTMQSQIIIRDKRNGQEVWRHTVDVKNLSNPHILSEFGDNLVFQNNIKTLSAATAESILYTLKDRKPILASKERYAAIYQP